MDGDLHEDQTDDDNVGGDGHIEEYVDEGDDLNAPADDQSDDEDYRA